MDARIIKQPDITRYGPQRPSEIPLPLLIKMYWTGNAIFISFFLESNKKT